MVPVCLALKHYHVLLAVLAALSLISRSGWPWGACGIPGCGAAPWAAGTLRHDLVIEIGIKIVGDPHIPSSDIYCI